MHSKADLGAVVVRALVARGFDYFTAVPDSGLAGALRVLEGRGTVWYESREDIAVAGAVGAWLAGARPVVLMKNAGLGTCIDALLSLANASGAQLLLVIGWAGTGSDLLPHHTVSGDATLGLLDACGIDTVRVSPHESEDEIRYKLETGIVRFAEQQTVSALLLERP